MDPEIEKIRKRNTWIIVVSAMLILMLNILFPKDKSKVQNHNWQSLIKKDVLIFQEADQIVGTLPLVPTINDSLVQLENWDIGISRRKAMVKDRNVQVYLLNDPRLICYWAEGELDPGDSTLTVFPGGVLEYQKVYVSKQIHVKGIVANQLPENEPVAAFELPSGKWLGFSIPNLDSTTTVEMRLNDIGKIEIALLQPEIDWVTLRYPMLCWIPNLDSPEDALHKHFQILSEMIDSDQ